MMLLIVLMTGVALFIAEHNATETFQQETHREFQSQITAINSARKERREILTERCRQLVNNSRIRAAYEDNALDLLYSIAEGELRGVFPQKDSLNDASTKKLRARFFRFLDEKGAVIPAPANADGTPGFNDSVVALPRAPLNQEFGYVLTKEPGGAEIVSEVIATPIISRDPMSVVGALILGFEAPELGEGSHAQPGLKSGIWLNGQLRLPGLSSAAAASIAGKLQRSTAATQARSASLPVEIDRVPHLLFFECLNPGSLYPAAYEVCLYSQAEALAEQRAVRWRILGTGAALLIAGLGASHILSVRLSKPVETLEVVSAENIVQRERAEAELDLTHEELRQRNAELQKALADLEKAHQQVVQQERLRALGQMASGIAHDFNNALVPILGFCELLQMSPAIFDDRQKCLSYLETIQTAAKDAASVVSRLREFYRKNAGDEKFTAVYLKRLVSQAGKLTQPKWKDQAQANGATIRMQLDLQDVPPVCGDESALREVLTNLIFNAVDAMPAGGTLIIRTRQSGDRGFLEVQDSGTGMTEEVRRRCLEPFFSTKGERGTGLGLSMVFGIVQRHSGMIDLQSVVGRGTTFRISLPLYQEEELSEPVEQPGPSRSLRVLVVDDEAAVRDLLQEALASEGHAVEVAEQGVDGLRRFLAGSFDLVVTDKAMPGMSGDQMAAAIKQVAPQTPIILLTGFGQFLDKESMPSIDVLVAKPLSFTGLRDAICRALAAAA
jgi:signal transduction histidine kinase